LSDFTDETLEGQFADQEFSRLLVATNLTESDGSWLVAMRFLYSSKSESEKGLDTSATANLPACGWSRFASGFGSELLSWGLATSGLSSCPVIRVS
jgi:hypothetical protein